MKTKAVTHFSVLALLTFLATPSVAVTGPELSLDATTSSEIENDEMSVVVAVERQGVNVKELSQSVLDVLQRNLAKVKNLDGVSARMGSVNTVPVWDNKGRTSSWTVRADISLKGSNFTVLAQLASEMTAEMMLRDVAFSLSPAKRDSEEARMIVEVATAYQKKADQLAKALGYKSFELKTLGFNREPVNIARKSRGGSEALMMSRSDASVPIPTDGGKSEVRVILSGVVELK
jgi:predicted secreted protein